jgi:WS/DGAT/MGAT family acyltransferase
MAQYGARLARRGIDTVAYAVSSRPKPDVSAMLQAPRTSFNRSIGPHRTIAFTSVALDDLKALRRHFDVKVNDVALAVCSGALRIYLDDRGELPARTLTAGVPVSTRDAGDTSLDNQVSYMVVPLATDVDDPTERLRAIHRHTRAAKEMNAALRVHPIGSLGQTAPPWALGAAMRLAYRSHLLSYVPGMMNTIVSNVPGPPFPLYLAGARLTGIFSASVILEGMGVNITIFSIDDRVDFGIQVDPELVPEPWDLAAAILDAVRELMAAAHLGAPAAVEDAFGQKSDSDAS